MSLGHSGNVDPLKGTTQVPLDLAKKVMAVRSMSNEGAWISKP